MSWEKYFECNSTYIGGGVNKYYEYKDKSVKTLPANLPMPPEDIFYLTFRDCHQLQDITALANWNVSNIKNMCCMLVTYQCNDTVKSMLRNLPKRIYPKQDHSQLLQSLWERVKPLLKYTTPLNNHFKHHAMSLALPSDWQSIEIPQWNP